MVATKSYSRDDLIGNMDDRFFLSLPIIYHSVSGIKCRGMARRVASQQHDGSPPWRGEHCQYARTTELAARVLFHAVPVASVWATATVYADLHRERLAQANFGAAV